MRETDVPESLARTPISLCPSIVSGRWPTTGKSALKPPRTPGHAANTVVTRYDRGFGHPSA